MNKDKKISTEPYKGVRDFFPEDQVIQNYIFSVWTDVVKKYGYVQYNSSILEPKDLYTLKSGEEIVNEQTYNFTDRGGREVTLRPEMTPSVARMVAQRKRELSFPLRWYSIPNLFRYEQPQRGRLREHFQLNVDIFGTDSLDAEVEMIQISHDIMKTFGLKNTDFEIRINNRVIMNYIFTDLLSLSQEETHKLSKLIDKKAKIDEKKFEELASEILGGKLPLFMTIFNSKNFEEFCTNMKQSKEEHKGLKDVHTVIKALERLGITNVIFDQTLMRGFDYYTGVVFEVFDTNPDNRRSLFGGGRYDDLLSLFGDDKVQAVGFGSGDVTMRDVLETYNLLPIPKSDTKIVVAPTDQTSIPYSLDLAQKFRESNINTIVDFSQKKIGDKIKSAVKQNIKYIVCIGPDEVKSGHLILKNLQESSELSGNDDYLVDLLLKDK
jgi:histidyl-tRNA synthetase